MFKQLPSFIAVSAAFCLFGAQPAYAPPKPKTAGDLNCAIPCVQEGEIEDGAISAAKLAPNSVTGDKIAPGTVTGLVIRDRDGFLVGSLISSVSSDTAVAVYHGDPADADFFGAFPFVVVELAQAFFRSGSDVEFQIADCDETGEIYINEPPRVFGVPRIVVINDPVIGAVAYVPTIPITPVGNAFWSSRLEQSGICVNISSNGGVTLAEPGVELGFFPPYSLSE